MLKRKTISQKGHIAFNSTPTMEKKNRRTLSVGVNVPLRALENRLTEALSAEANLEIHSVRVFLLLFWIFYSSVE